MKDALLDFGSMTLATKTTAVYSDVLDFGAFSAFTKHTMGMDKPMDLVVLAAANFNAADSVIITIQDSADNSSYADLISGPTITAPTIASKIGNLQLPAQHRRYVRIKAYPNSSGTLTETIISAFLEPGANHTV